MLVAPAALKRPKELLTHGDVRIDDYYWLRDDSRTNPEVDRSAPMCSNVVIGVQSMSA